MADKKLKIIIEAIDNASKPLSSLSGSVEKLAAGMRKTGEAMVKLGAAPTAALTLSAKAAIDFEDAFAGVRKTVDASEEEFAQLSQNFRDIAKTAPTSAVELSHIGEIAGQLGVRGVDNITKFTKTIADIAVTTNLTTEAAASDFARIANIMGEPIENVDRMASSVVDLGNNFATTESEIVNFANRIAGAGKIAGLNTANIMGIGAAMSSVGVEAEAGGTAVQKVLIAMTQAASGSKQATIDNTSAIAAETTKVADLSKKLEIAKMQQSEFSDKTKDSTKAMKEAQIDKYAAQLAGAESKIGALKNTHGKAAISVDTFAKVLGVTNKEFEKMFKQDPAKVFEDFINVLGKGGQDAIGILEDLELTDQRLVRAFLSLSNAGDLVNRTMDTSDRAWKENTALMIEAEKRYTTTASQLKILKNNVVDLGIGIGSTLLPSINQIVEKLVPAINRLSDFASEHQNLVTGVLVGGTALFALGTSFIFISSAITSLMTILGGLKVALVGLWGIMVANPLFLVAAAVAALTIALGALIINSDILKSKSELLAEAHDRQVAANDRLKDSYDRVKQAGQELEGAELNLEGAQLRRERAQKTLDENTKMYGENALITRESAHQLELAEKDLKDAQENVNKKVEEGQKALDDYDKAQEDAKKAGEEMDAALETSESVWSRLGDAIKGVISKIREYTTLDKGDDSGYRGLGAMQHGGTIPGAFNQPVPIIAHGGERVIPKTGTDVNAGGGGMTLNLTIQGDVNSEDMLDRIVDSVKSALGRDNELAAQGVSV